jgi:hypothetical protein
VAKVTRTEFAAIRFRSRGNARTQRHRHSDSRWNHICGYNGGIVSPGIVDKQITTRARRSQERQLIRQQLEEAPAILAEAVQLATMKVVQKVTRHRGGVVSIRYELVA